MRPPLLILSVAPSGAWHSAMECGMKHVATYFRFATSRNTEYAIKAGSSLRTPLFMSGVIALQRLLSRRIAPFWPCRTERWISLPERLHQGADLLGTGAAAAADDLHAFVDPAAGVGDKLVGRRAGRPVPLVAQVGAPVGVGAERQGGVPPQPGATPSTCSRRQAVDQDGADAHLLEAAGGAAEAVAILDDRLALDADDLADRAAVGDPERDAGVEEDLVVGKLQVLGDLLLDLHQDQVGLVVGVGRRQHLGERLQVALQVERHVGAGVVARLLLLRRPASPGSGRRRRRRSRPGRPGPRLRGPGGPIERHPLPGVLAADRAGRPGWRRRCD